MSSDHPTILPDHDSGPPERIGDYRILEVLGQGGMGVVYLAEQRGAVRRRVALKVIKLGMDSRQVLARFEAERQALALMDHENIARVYEAGTTERGQPYFAMEYVKGVPITEYCDGHRLSVPERLALFRKVCAGVQHAHHKGVMHRDLKPSNILVAPQDDAPVPKIIDFGLARATDHQLTQETLFTEHGQILGTPEYMSPEQAGGSSSEVDTRTDVYSLGVVLYQLLVGELPFQPTDLRRAGLAEIQRKIREDEPPKPSTRLASAPATTAQVAKQRGTDTRALLRRVRGDLDWVVLRALEKDRSRRYQTPSELAADIERHLRDEPVLAGPPSLGYRARKFVRRHRGQVTAAAAVVVVMLAGTAVSVLQAVRATRAEAVAQVERDRARSEAAKAARTAEFVQAMLSGVDPSVAKGQDTTLLRMILDEAAGRIDGTLAEDPDAAASIHRTVGRTYASIGVYDAADRHWRAALETWKRLRGEEDRDVLSARSALASLLMEQGRQAEADAAGRAVIEDQRRLLGPDDDDTLASTSRLARVLGLEGRFDDAEALLRDVLERRQRVHGPDDPDALEPMMTLATILHYREQSEEAVLLLRRVVAARTSALGADHPTTLTASANLAMVLESRDDGGEADALHRAIIAGMSRVYGPEHPQTLKARNNYGSFLQRRGRFAEAERVHREVLETRRRVLGPEHPLTLFSIHNLGMTMAKLGRAEEAEVLLRQALEARRRTLGESHVDTQRSLDGLGTFLHGERRFAEAAEVMGEQVSAMRAAFGDADRRIPLALYNWAACLQDAGKDAEAEPVFRDVLARCADRANPKPFELAAMNGLGKTLMTRGDAAGAEAAFREALAGRRRLRADVPSEVADSLEGLAEALEARQDGAAAEPLLREAIALRTQTGQPWAAAEDTNRLGACLAALGRLDEAEPLLLQGYAGMADEPRAAGAPLRRAAERVARYYELRGRPDDAAKWRAR